jgi:hypothetical protein
VVPPAFHVVSELSWHGQNVSKADWPRNTFIVLCLITTPLPFIFIENISSFPSCLGMVASIKSN